MSGRRSLIPRVAGTLMIVFGGLGLLSGLLLLTAGDFMGSTLPLELRQRIRSYILIDQGLGLLLSGVQLAAGILAVTHRRGAPYWALGFGVLVIAQQGIRLAIYHQTIAPALSRLFEVADQVPRIGRAVWVLTGICAAWGVLMATLMLLPASRRACRGQV